MSNSPRGPRSPHSITGPEFDRMSLRSDMLRDFRDLLRRWGAEDDFHLLLSLHCELFRVASELEPTRETHRR